MLDIVNSLEYGLFCSNSERQKVPSSVLTYCACFKYFGGMVVVYAEQRTYVILPVKTFHTFVSMYRIIVLFLHFQ